MLNLHKSLPEIIKSFAAKKYGAGRIYFGIELPTSYAQIAKLICDNIQAPPEQILATNNLSESLSNQSQKLLSVNKDAGNIVKFDTDIASKKTADIDEVREAEIIISPGLGGGDTSERLYSTLSEFRRLFPQKKCAIYSPLNEGKNRMIRHARGALYYVNQNLINEEESSNFFNKVIKPKITDKSGKLLPPESCQKFVLANFSIGCREAESHFRYFIMQLERAGLHEDIARKYLDRMALLNIASPRNWEPLADQPYTLSIISLTDAGSKKPPQFLLDFYLNEKINSQEISKILRPFPGDMKKEMLVIMGLGVATTGGVREKSGPFISNPLGHNLANHIDGIKNNSELSRLITSFDFFLDQKISDQEFVNFRKDLFFKEGSSYKRNFENPSEEGMKALFETWDSYQEMEKNAKRNSPFAARFLRKQPAPESACSHEILTFPEKEIDIQR